ncbi:MAG: hypothetical protein WC609_03905 [Candidatus Paceibacterota bacterium]|jgi:hypothetical protein
MNDQLTGLIQDGKTNQAIEMVRGTKNYHESEEFVFVVLREEKSMPDLVEAALEAFLGTRENRHEQHGYWVHSLSHFTHILWKRRMDGWIKRFNRVSFMGANELRDPNCSDRLVDDFVRYAKFDDEPADFHLTAENLRWMKKIPARIKTHRFDTEKEFLLWKLRQPAPLCWDNDAQTELVDLSEFQNNIEQLQKLGADISEFNETKMDLLAKQLSKLESELPSAQDRKRERLEKGIQKTREALSKIN